MILLLLAESAYVMAQVVEVRAETLEVDRGSEWGIRPGMRGGIFRVPRGQGGGIYGIAQVDSVWEGGALLIRKTPKEVILGDLIQLKVELGGEGWNTDPLLSALRLHVILTDTAGQPILWGDPGDHTSRDSALRVMVELARWEAERLEGLTDTAGRTLDQVLGSADTALVLEFLYFVTDFPVAYMGRELPFPEAIATWALWGCPPSGRRAALRLVEAQDPGALASRYDRRTLMVALDWLCRMGKRELALSVARATGDQELIRLVEEAP